MIGRDRDVPALRRMGRVETLGAARVRPAPRSVDDRTFRLYRVTPKLLATEDTERRKSRN